jgi:hypothetical protein
MDQESDTMDESADELQATTSETIQVLAIPAMSDRAVA